MHQTQLVERPGNLDPPLDKQAAERDGEVRPVAGDRQRIAQPQMWPRAVGSLDDEEIAARGSHVDVDRLRIGTVVADADHRVLAAGCGPGCKRRIDVGNASGAPLSSTRSTVSASLTSMSQARRR